ncbi:hypothetical protein TCAL_07045 [Tigriopus californicus]|uniref:Mpv17-like protein n=1 Tax=Tigriopus californicus TaxID=6832 RepID=A0A553PQP4_TIGCA|nr:mpv17-like protein [Tigriopus californicus]TRY80000.1 hypothetical protein TCAL_07045 [Tigriopus californicus]
MSLIKAIVLRQCAYLRGKWPKSVSIAVRHQSSRSFRISRYPILADTVKFGLLFTGAELTQQVLMKKVLDTSFQPRTFQEPIDWSSVAKYSIWGFFIFPHVLRKWYKFLDANFIGTSWNTVIKKTLVDQAVFPVPILSSFYVFLSVLEGKTESFKSVTEECATKLQTTLFARYCFMIPAQLLNFAFVQPNKRVLYVGVITFFWLNILCVLKSLSLDHSLFKKMY